MLEVVGEIVRAGRARVFDVVGIMIINCGRNLRKSRPAPMTLAHVISRVCTSFLPVDAGDMCVAEENLGTHSVIPSIVLNCNTRDLLQLLFIAVRAGRAKAMLEFSSK